MKIRTRLFLIALLPILFLLGSALVQFEFSKTVDRHNKNFITIEGIQREFSDLTILTHEHFLYFAERTKVQWEAKYLKIGRDIEGAASLLTSNEEKSHIAEISKRYRTIGYLFTQYHRGGAAENSGGVDEQRRLFENRINVRLLQELELVRFSISQLGEISRKKVDESGTNKERASIVLLAAMALAIPAVSWLIYKDFAKPVKKLQEGMKAIARGDTDYRIGLTQKDEIGDLSAAFDDLNRQRKVFDDLLRKANAELEARVDERTLELSLANEKLSIEVMERMEAEAHLAELNHTLSERVEEETKKRVENERMMLQQSRLAAMGEMIGSIAHQWRQPLNAVSAIVQDLRDAEQCGELDADYLNRSTETAMDNITFMSKTIDDFRNFFRPDKEKREFDIKRVAGEVLGMVAPQLKSLNIECRLTCRVHDITFTDFSGHVKACGEMTILGYENESKQVFLNLVANAKDAIIDRRAREGNPELPGRVALTFDVVDGRVVITITDNGGGIPDEIIGRIFEPYFTTKEASRGTGLGLYMCKMIVEKNMGGVLSARNTDGGAEFVMEVS